MFKNRVVFMIYCFKGIKSPVDTKAKNSLTSYPAQAISKATAAQPRAALPDVTQKGILILLTEVAAGNNGRDKNSNYDFFSLAKHRFSMADGMINDTFGSQSLKM